MSNDTILPDSKRCTLCGEFKPLEMFYQNKARKHSFSSRCKACMASHQHEHKEERNAYKADWAARNPDKIIASQDKFKALHPEKIRQSNLSWKQSHPDADRVYREQNDARIKAQKKDYRKRNRAIILDRWRDYCARNPQDVALRKRKWHENNPCKVKATRHNRRARIMDIGGSFTDKDIENIYIMQGGICCYCGMNQPLTVEHVIPASREGSSNDSWNLALACKACNSSKKDRLLEEWVDRWYLRE